MRRRFFLLFVVASAAVRADEPSTKIGEKLPRRGDEIMVCGQLYHTTTRVVLWTDPGGYDAYASSAGLHRSISRDGGQPRLPVRPRTFATPTVTE